MGTPPKPQAPTAIVAITYRWRGGSSSGTTTELFTSRKAATDALGELWYENLDGRPPGRRIDDPMAWVLQPCEPLGQLKLEWVPLEFEWPDLPKFAERDDG